MHFAWHAVVSTLPVAAGLSGASLQRWRRRLDAAAWGHKTSKDQCHRLAVPGGPPSPVGGRAQDAADGVALGPPEGVTGASCGYRYPQGVRRTSPAVRETGAVVVRQKVRGGEASVCRLDRRRGMLGAARRGMRRRGRACRLGSGAQQQPS